MIMTVNAMTSAFNQQTVLFRTVRLSSFHSFPFEASCIIQIFM